MKRAILVLPLILTTLGCTVTVSDSTSPSPSATTSRTVAASPSPNSTTSPRTAGPAFGVLVDLLTLPSTYLANVVGVDGRLWASMKVDKRTQILTQKGRAIQLPYVSTSTTALYMLSGDSTVLSLKLPDGKQVVVAHLDVGPNMEAAFAVSPDDSQIAVSVLDFNRTPVHVTLYTETLSGGNHHVIFESDSNYVWPVAWHSGLLVLAHAYGPYEEDIAKAAPGQDDPYSAISYHIVDPATANRIYLLGTCTVSGPLSPAGSACIQGGTIDWRGNVSPPWSTRDWGSISSAAALSADGTMVAAAEPDDPMRLAIWRPDGTVATWVNGPGARDWAGWLDGDHILVGSALNNEWEPRIVRLSGGPVVSLTIHGFYAARLPTDIV